MWCPGVSLGGASISAVSGGKMNVLNLKKIDFLCSEDFNVLSEMKYISINNC